MDIVIQAFLLVVLVPVIGFNVFLLGLHTYLVARNLTTRELVSWKYVSYLKNRKKESPFNRGVAMNLKQFCKWNSYPKTWVINY